MKKRAISIRELITRDYKRLCDYGYTSTGKMFLDFKLGKERRVVYVKDLLAAIAQAADK